MADKYSKIVPSTCRLFIGHYQELHAYMKSFLKEFFRFFITLQNYVNADLDKTEMLMNLKKKKRMLSTEIEYYQEI